MIKIVLLDFFFILGGWILGKVVCEDLCCFVSSFIFVFGFVKNLYDLIRSIGGLSFGLVFLVIKFNDIFCIILMIDKLNIFI